ncbi:hypothetical protein IJG27_01150 [Candidatus Saccharibacteria bacterium]|nr:hypothetical protein [Candidatus Saccharibacteria bacterium]
MDNKSSGMPGQAGPVYTAAFTQPISTPMGDQPKLDPIPGAYEQVPGAVQPAQPMPAQPMPGQPTMGQPIASSPMMNQPMPGQMPGVAPQMPNMEQNPITGQPIMSQTSVPVMVAPKKDVKSLFKTIAIIALSLLSLTFIGLFIWMNTQYDALDSNVNDKITEAVAEERDQVTTKLEEQFAEREKEPYRTFAGPEDYGALTFEYPKTWSVYVASDASKGGDYNAYFNPIEVGVVSNTTLDALRVSILDTAFDDVVSKYQKELEGSEAQLRLESVTIGQNNDIVANRYSGVIPDTEFNGYVVVFKVRDKTVILQTDSVLFENDFNTLLSTVRFNA